MCLLSITPALIADLLLCVMALLIAHGVMMILAALARKFLRKSKKRGLFMKPKDLLQFLETGDRSMEDLEHRAEVVTDLSVSLFQLLGQQGMIPRGTAQLGYNQSALGNMQSMYGNPNQGRQ